MLSQHPYLRRSLNADQPSSASVGSRHDERFGDQASANEIRILMDSAASVPARGKTCKPFPARPCASWYDDISTYSQRGISPNAKVLLHTLLPHFFAPSDFTTSIGVVCARSGEPLRLTPHIALQNLCVRRPRGKNSATANRHHASVRCARWCNHA